MKRNRIILALPVQLLKLLRDDAKRTGRPRNGIITVALNCFYRYKTEIRDAEIVLAPIKKRGRNILT